VWFIYWRRKRRHRFRTTHGGVPPVSGATSCEACIIDEWDEDGARLIHLVGLRIGRFKV
jgi:hypothetical protein